MSEAMESSFFNLINSYSNGAITPVVFEEKYIELWNRYSQTEKYGQFNESTDGAFDKIFSAVDCFCSNVNLRDENDLDENGLYEEVKKIMEELKGKTI